MGRLLLVEDDEAIGSALRTALTTARHQVDWCRNGRSAIQSAESDDPDLVILDLGLPDLDGMDVCRALRTRLPRAVIVILTARDSEIDIVVGLEAGADDYLTKPVRTTELLARLRAHLRRSAARPDQPVVRADSMTVDIAARRAWLSETELDLRNKEFDLLARLASQAGVAVTRADLMADVWDANWHGSTKTLDVHVAALRKILADAEAKVGTRAPAIETLRGFGYRLSSDAASQSPDRPQ